MDLLKRARQSTGVGLKGSAHAVALHLQPDADAAKKTVAPLTRVAFTEPASVHVLIDSDTPRSAVLAGGERTGYSQDELFAAKDTPLSHGRVDHVFLGTLRQGTSVRHGPGSMHYAGGEVFIGAWRNHRRAGPGSLTAPGGYSYEGHFKNDAANGGGGREIFPGGDQYVGEFVDGRPGGRGTMHYAGNGSRHEGEFVDGEKHGPGVVYYGNGDVFQGTWAAGRRQGSGITTYAANGRSYESQWSNDVCGFATKFVHPSNVPAVAPAVAPLLEAVLSPLGVDLREMTVMPPLSLDVHPSSFARIKAGFEGMDADCVGTVDLAHVRSMWALLLLPDVGTAADNATLSMAGSMAMLPLDAGPDQQDLPNVATLVALQEASRNGVTIDLTEAVAALYPHLPAQDLRRLVAAEVAPETIHRLRGVLAGVVSKGADTFTAVAQGGAVVSWERVQVKRGMVGGNTVTSAMFDRAAEQAAREEGRAAAASSGDSVATAARHDARTITFPQLLQQLYPSLSAAVVARVEVETLPAHVLRQYAASFDELDDTATQYLSLERLKGAQRRYQLVAAGQHMMDAAAPGAYEARAVAGVHRSAAAWHVGDVAVTVAWAKLVDRMRTGYVSLVELLRCAYPNIQCLWSRERYGMAVRSEEVCRCALCDFCGERYFKQRPANPYTDGTAVW
jgi:hypothetical protein